MNKTFANIGDELLARIHETEPQLLAIPEADAALRPSPDKWSKKEIVGHLIHSANNNHQRFVRGTEFKGGTYPGYHQDYLIGLEKPNDYPWPALVGFWAAYNRYLSHVLKQLPESAGEHMCAVGEYPPATLRFIADDYVEHLKHHLNQALGTKYKTTYGA